MNGIPTAITFDVVKCGDCFGTVYELIDAVQLSKYLRDNPQEGPALRKKYARMIKDMHGVTLSGDFPNKKDQFRNWISGLGKYYSQDEINSLFRLIDVIPDRDTIVHGDAHVGNVMVQDGELILIDMADMGRGHPIFDFAALYYHYQLVPGTPGRSFGLQTVLGFLPETNDFTDELWKDLVMEYFQPKNEEEFAAISGIARIAAGLQSIVNAANQPQLEERYKLLAINGTKMHYLPRIEGHIQAMKNVDAFFAR